MKVEASRVIGEFQDYQAMVNIIRERVQSLHVHGERFDEFAGLPIGYLSKLIGRHPVRRIGMTSLGPLFQALGLKCVVVEDDEGTARLKKRIKDRSEDHVRQPVTHRKIDFIVSRHARRIAKKRWENTSEQERIRAARIAINARWKRRRKRRKNKAIIAGMVPITELISNGPQN